MSLCVVDWYAGPDLHNRQSPTQRSEINKYVEKVRQIGY
jgi:hypothetical protein